MSTVIEPRTERSVVPSDEATTIVEQVYRQLRREIVNLQLVPGTRLGIDFLRTRFGASSSAIREALLLLVADMLVTTVAQRGFRVAPMSLADFLEIRRLRSVLERMALQESLVNGDDNWEAALVAAGHRLSLVDSRKDPFTEAEVALYNERNAAFHEALAAASPSAWNRRFRLILYNAAERYRMLGRRRGLLRPNRDVHEEHIELMSAALARDVELVCRLTEEHIDRSVVLELFDETGNVVL